MSQNIQRVTLLVAMQAEADPIIEHFQLKLNQQALNPQLPMRCYQGQVNSIFLSLVINGQDKRYAVDNIGCEAAVLATYESIVKLSPEIIISAGTAGGFSAQGAKIGLVYASADKFIFHDRIVPIAGFTESSVGHFPAAKIDKLCDDLNLPKGIISTGSSLKKTADEVAIIKQHNAVAKEMEAAAVAWVGMLLGKPVMALKSITNLIDEENQSEQEFIKNLSLASSQLKTSVIEVINYLNNKTLQDLA
ncbi:phosphorylase family protein [Aliikangiella sp. IMCC44653]